MTLLAEDVGSLSLEPQSVDVAVFSQSLHHLDDPFSGIRQAYRLLRPGGLLAVMELAAHDPTLGTGKTKAQVARF
ncbi:MAG: hypothetical protein Ct9H90mP9_1890 [Pseudomonadota bacterium]|nr:MAG: hypothetical protein Ct9H90mP9_1890 [Pseudomonadota bacterium]